MFLFEDTALKALPYTKWRDRPRLDFGPPVISHKKQNIREWELLKRLSRTKDSKHFPKPIARDPDWKWILVERVFPRRGAPSNQDRETVDRLVEKYDLGLDFNSSMAHNWCCTDNGPVIYDLGVE